MSDLMEGETSFVSFELQNWVTKSFSSTGKERIPENEFRIFCHFDLRMETVGKTLEQIEHLSKENLCMEYQYIKGKTVPIYPYIHSTLNYIKFDRTSLSADLRNFRGYSENIKWESFLWGFPNICISLSYRILWKKKKQKKKCRYFRQINHLKKTA